MNSLVLVTVSLNLSFFIFLISSSVEIIFIIFIKSSLFRSFKNSSNISSFDFVFFGLPEPLPFLRRSSTHWFYVQYLNWYLFSTYSLNLFHWSSEMCSDIFYFHHFIQKTFFSEFPRSNIFRIFQTNISIH